MPTLRTAVAADLDGIVDVFLDCWRISYAGSLPAELVAGMTPAKARAMWTQTMEERTLSLLVAASDLAPHPVQGLVGFRLEPDGTGYIGSLYVSPRAQGGGIGRLLLTEAESRLREAGAAQARLWVFRANAPSIEFYRRLGWEPDGRVETLTEWGQPQQGMSKSLRT